MLTPWSDDSSIRRDAKVNRVSRIPTGCGTWHACVVLYPDERQGMPRSMAWKRLGELWAFSSTERLHAHMPNPAACHSQGPGEGFSLLAPPRGQLSALSC